jgi:uncharacterized protein (TIGR02646 family)
MRTVDRGLVARPAPLDPIQTAADVTAYRACTSTSGVKQRIYGHQDVVYALHNIFFRKCSFCEADATHSGEVEHFIPHSPDRAELAYDWMNLHWACRACNQRKRREKYKEFRTGTRIVERTLLIDSTAPHGGFVKEMLTFDDDLNAQPTSAYLSDLIVQLTSEFLNDSLPWKGRSVTYKALQNFVIEAGCIDEWRALIELEQIDPNVRPDPARAKRALDSADRLYLLYLDERKPFSASMRCLLVNELRLPFEGIARLGRHHRASVRLPALY